MSKHNEAVKKLARKHKFGPKKTLGVYADNVSEFPDPEISVGAANHVPDVHVKWTNGRDLIIEVDSGRSMSSAERKQHEAFERSEQQITTRSYKHYFAYEVL